MYRFTAGIVRENKEISQLTFVYENLEELRVGLRTSIICQRDYVITKDLNYLNEYHLSKSKNFELLTRFNNLDYQGVMTNQTVDSIYQLMVVNYKHLDSFVKQDSLGMDQFENDAGLYAVDIFKRLFDINKSLENRIVKKFNEFRSKMALNAHKSEYLIIFVYGIAIIILLVCFWVLVQQIKQRKILVNKLKENNRLKDMFFSIIAHDLRTPFQVLMYMSEIHKDFEGHKDKDQLIHELMLGIENITTKTYNLLNNLLQWANCQTGVLKLKKENTNIADLIKEVAEFYDVSIRKKNINLKLPANHIIVKADKNMIATVLRNLVGNAIKFVPAHGIIELQILKMEKYVEISVIDNGKGLPDDDYDKLFKLNVDTRKIGSPEGKGSGLGLILCKEFIELHSGTISARANKDKGCTFSFTLPH